MYSYILTLKDTFRHTHKHIYTIRERRERKSKREKGEREETILDE